MRYVTLCEQDENGFSLVERWPSADREEVAGAVNEEYAETVPVMIPEVVPVLAVTTHKDGSTTTETYEKSTGSMVPDPSGAMVETGVTLTRMVDPGGRLCVYAGEKLLKQYEAGVWRSCSADPPPWHPDYVAEASA